LIVPLLANSKAVSAIVRVMSGLPPKADIAQHGGNVRFVPKAEVATVLVHGSRLR
jgi:hypothetical protein